MKHPRYAEWILAIFRPRGDEANEFSASPSDIAELIRDTFLHAGDDLRSLSDQVVNDALWDLVSLSTSDYMRCVHHSPVPVVLKCQLVASIATLYRTCFAKRCAPTLGHIDEPGASPLNAICYMFWDIFCPDTSEADDPDSTELSQTVFSTLSEIIRIDHRACIEGGLHGLGELAYRSPKEVMGTIDTFLAECRVDDTLRGYANRARVGMVQ